jgi:hypothetical protein
MASVGGACRALVGPSLLLAGAGVAWAGLSLEAALARDERIAAGRSWSGLVALAPPAGLTVAAEVSRNAEAPLIAPQFVAGPFNTRGGIRFQSEVWSAAPTTRARLGVAWREGPGQALEFEGTSLAWRLDESSAGEFYASVERRHWGPGWAGSLILDGAAPAIPALGWRRAPVQASNGRWTSWVGPWGADFFFGRLQGHERAARPQFIGMRLLFEPLPGFEIGLARGIQWGGRGRDESARSLWDSLLGNDNVGFDGITAENEPGNQLAGLDFRWLVDRATSTSIYGQMVGEDEAGHFPSRNTLLVGADARLPTERGALRLFVEWTDTLAGRASRDPRPGVTYRHPAYERGYTQEGVVLGHPIGGDVKVGSLGLLYREAGVAAMVTASIGDAEPTAQFFAPGRVLGLNAALQFDVDAWWRIGASAAAWQDRVGRRGSAQLWLLRRL